MDSLKVVQDYVDAFAHGDVDACADAFAPDGSYRDPGTTGALSGQAIKDTSPRLPAGSPIGPANR
jgi:hypothetical protein